MNSDDAWTKILTIQFKFAQHCNPDYQSVHDILNAAYSEPLTGIEDLFVDTIGFNVVPEAAEALRKKILGAIAAQADPSTNDNPSIAEKLFGKCPMYARVDGDDEDRQPLRNRSSFQTILDHAIKEKTDKITIFLNINALHFREKFTPENLNDMATTPFADTKRAAVSGANEPKNDLKSSSIVEGIRDAIQDIAQVMKAKQTQSNKSHAPASAISIPLRVQSVNDDMPQAIYTGGHNNSRSFQSRWLPGGGERTQNDRRTGASHITAVGNGLDPPIPPDPMSVTTNTEDLQQAIIQSPESIDRILSRKLLQLSMRDRNAIDEEIHGISTLAPEESPTFLKMALDELAKELAAIPDSNPIKAAYLQSQEFPNTYVNHAGFRLRFLRCELFHASKAAIRLVNYLSLASDLFGPEALVRPIRLSDFPKEEKRHIQVGNIQVLPFRDRGGRPILAWVGDLGLEQGTVQSRQRMSLYFFHAMSDDIESQRKGMIWLIWVGSNSTSLASPKWEDFGNGKRFFGAIPLRICCTHFCLPDKPFFHMLRSAIGMTLGLNLARLKCHVGEETELLYTLKTFGIPVELIPVTGTGNIRVLNLRQWMRVRDVLEETEGDSSETLPSVIECPRSTDVIFRRGASLLHHSGNSHFYDMIESKLQEHSNASQVEKMTITKSIISAVHERGGRFLTWDKRGWWTELEEESPIHLRVAHKLRDVRVRRNISQQTSRSSTSVFQNQDHRKRRKIDREDADGSHESSTTTSCFTCL